MRDFFTRVAERATRTGLSIQPVVVSRYAPDLPGSGLESGVEPGTEEPPSHSAHYSSRARPRSTAIDPQAKLYHEHSTAALVSTRDPSVESSLTGDEFGTTRASRPASSPDLSSIAPGNSKTQTQFSASEDPQDFINHEDFGRELRPKRSQIVQSGDLVSTSNTATSPEDLPLAPSPGSQDVEGNLARVTESAALTKTDHHAARIPAEFHDDPPSTLIVNRDPLLGMDSGFEQQATNGDNSLSHDFVTRDASPLRSTQALPTSFNQRGDEAPSVIRVTIGRIDVRAVTPPADREFEPAAPSAPRISLEDFLSEHNRRRQ